MTGGKSTQSVACHPHSSRGDEILVTPWRSWDLIAILTWREIAGRYRGSLLGMLWPVLTPIIMLGLYTVVFGVILPSRWPSALRPSG